MKQLLALLLALLLASFFFISAQTNQRNSQLIAAVSSDEDKVLGCDSNVLAKVYYYMGTCSDSDWSNYLNCIQKGMQSDFAGTYWNAWAVKGEYKYWIDVLDGCSVTSQKDGHDVVVWRSS